MTKYRNNLPQMSTDVFITDGGLETTLIFHNGIELPYFAAFDLLKDNTGYETIQKYYQSYVDLASRNNIGLILDSPTWRASIDWAQKLGYNEQELSDLNKKSISMLSDMRDLNENNNSKIVISGCVGPRSDGYKPKFLMNEIESEKYHQNQIQTFSKTNADMITGLTINYVEEAIGIIRAAKNVDMPVVIAFTVETDGRLVTGQSLKDAIAYTDKVTNNAVEYFMINCAHPNHFVTTLDGSSSWINRIKGVRANASEKSHAELDESTELDDGDPEMLAEQYRELRTAMNHLNVLGGCCGTDHRHIEHICNSCVTNTR